MFVRFFVCGDPNASQIVVVVVFVREIFCIARFLGHEKCIVFNLLVVEFVLNEYSTSNKWVSRD